jgi:radical SAM PhpK family P-methyltransferase
MRRDFIAPMEEAMKEERDLDCIVIGYNEIPFQRYERILRSYGEDSEAYRDLKFSFVDLGGEKFDYVNLLNHVTHLARPNQTVSAPNKEFKSGDIPNLAAVYLTNYLGNRGFNARYINLFQQEKDKLLEYLAQKPRCVAITTTFYVINQPVNEIVEFIRENSDGVKIVVGGPLIANHARNYKGDEFKAILDDMGADVYVIEGQGEFTLWQITACLKNGGDLSAVSNIAYIQDGELRRTAAVGENNSLDENYIDWRCFSQGNLGNTLQTRAARSCAFKCSFCNYPARAGALSLLGLDVLEKELDSMLALGNVMNVVFIDDTFNVPILRFKDICRMMIRKKYPFNWFSYFRCSNSDEEAIDLMAESGCKGVFLGIESGSPPILQNMNKSATIEKYAIGIERLRKNGILTFGSFITGFPGETEKTVNDTISFIQQTKPDYYRSQLWYCEPGTPIDRERAKYNTSGEGFVWTHSTMDSLEAMDHIDKMFLKINESIWLPQWSFDFWIIPYLLGKGITFAMFKEFMSLASGMLKLDIASVSDLQKQVMQQEYLQNMVSLAKKWNLPIS